MKKLLKFLPLPVIAFFLLGATSTALYLHHERSTLATLEADLQNREIGLDPADKSAVGKFSDGTKFHLVSQEMPNVSLVGSLGVTGAVTLSNNLTLSLIPTGRVPYTTTSGLIANSASLAFDGTTFGTQNGTYSGILGVTGVATFTAAPVFSSVTASQILSVNGSKALTSTATTGSGNVVLATSPSLVTPALGVASATSMALGGNEAFTYDEGSFTLTLVGCTTLPTTTAHYVLVGKMVTLTIPIINATSNSDSLVMTGLPAAIRASADNPYFPVSGSYSNGVFKYPADNIMANVTSFGSIVFQIANNSHAWPAFGTKGLLYPLVITYQAL